MEITQDIEDEIRTGIKSARLDFVAWAGGPWTAAGVDCAILDLKTQTSVQHGLICLHPIKAGSYIVSRDTFVSRDLPDIDIRLVSRAPSLGGLSGFFSLLKLIFRGAPAAR